MEINIIHTNSQMYLTLHYEHQATGDLPTCMHFNSLIMMAIWTCDVGTKLVPFNVFRKMKKNNNVASEQSIIYKWVRKCSFITLIWIWGNLKFNRNIKSKSELRNQVHCLLDMHAVSEIQAPLSVRYTYYDV